MFSQKIGSVLITTRTIKHVRSLVPFNAVPNYEISDSDIFDFQQMIDDTTRKHQNNIGKNVENSPALVLNADYTPLNHLPLSLWSWQDALRAVFNDKAVVVSEYSDLCVRSVSCSFRLPSVIALKRYHHVINKVPPMSRRNVYIRDGFKCQVCTISEVFHVTLGMITIYINW